MPKAVLRAPTAEIILYASFDHIQTYSQNKHTYEKVLGDLLGTLGNIVKDRSKSFVLEFKMHETILED